MYVSDRKWMRMTVAPCNYKCAYYNSTKMTV